MFLKAWWYLRYNFSEIENTMDKVIFMCVSKCSSDLDDVPQDEACIEVWYLLSQRKIAKIHRLNYLVHITGIALADVLKLDLIGIKESLVDLFMTRSAGQLRLEVILEENIQHFLRVRVREVCILKW